MNRIRRLPRVIDYWGRSSELLSIGTQFLRGKRYQVSAMDADIYNFLGDLARYLRHTDCRPGRLLPLRADFRQIFRREYLPIGLVYSLTCHDSLHRRLAAWLLGRCMWPRGVVYLRNCPPQSPVQLQFEVARALKRLRAWSELRQFEIQLRQYCAKRELDEFPWPQTIAEDPIWVERLKGICEQHAARDHSERLSDFLSRGVASTSPFESSESQRQPFWYQEPLGPGQPAKSRWHIRRILERIRRAVRGQT